MKVNANMGSLSVQEDKNTVTFEHDPQTNAALPSSAVRESSRFQLGSNLLRQELLQPEKRAIWEKYLSQNDLSYKNDQNISYRSVSRAIAEHQRRTYGDNLEVIRYKDRVRRALLGHYFSIETLRLFEDTFELSSQTVQQLIGLLQAEKKDLEEDYRQQYFFNSAIFDITVGEDGQAKSCRCTYSVQALKDNCDSFFIPKIYRMKEIRAVSGCTVTFSQEKNGWQFTFDRVLCMADCITVSYETELENYGDSSIAVGCLAQQKAVSLRILFEGNEPPTQLKKYRLKGKVTTNNFQPEQTAYQEIHLTSNRYTEYFHQMNNITHIFSWK